MEKHPPVVQDIHAVPALQMAALDHHVAGPHPMDRDGRPLHILHRPDFHPRQDARLVQVGRHNDSERQQQADQRVPRLGPQELVPALGNHHGVHNQVRQRVLPDFRGHDSDNPSVGQHPRLDRVHADVGDYRVYLEPHEVGGKFVDTLDAESVLGRDGRQRAHAVDAQRGEGLQVGLNPGPASRIRTGNRQTPRQLHPSILLMRLSPKVVPPFLPKRVGGTRPP